MMTFFKSLTGSSRRFPIIVDPVSIRWNERRYIMDIDIVMTATTFVTYDDTKHYESLAD